jgi:SAM-dependent methyltransferase
MMRKVEQLAGPLRAYVANLASEMRIERLEFERLYAPRAGRLGFRVAAGQVAQRAAWGIAAQWLVGYAVGSLSSDATLADAEDWFLDAETGLPRFAPPIEMVREIQASPRDQLFALLPYLLDPLAPATRRCLLKSNESLDDRLTRKAAGIYYTPADVAQYMADNAGAFDAASCLDPACGTGVFLRAAQARGVPAAFGCDSDPLVAEPCAFVLLANELRAIERAHPWRRWHMHRLNLATVDSLLVVPGSRLDDVSQRSRAREIEEARASLWSGETPPPAPEHAPGHALGELFPDLVDGADLVLCNPPYARLRDHPERERLSENFASLSHGGSRSTIETSTPFVEHGWGLTKAGSGRAAIVVPLSMAFNSTAQFRSLRGAMSQQAGEWRCAFFDRTPDALFGDDVKTRNAILFYDAGAPKGLQTTPLLRWTSRTRSRFFETIQFTAAGRLDGYEPIPKLGNADEARLYLAIRSLGGRLGDSFVGVKAVRVEEAPPATPTGVFVAPTAYNWLSCSRSLEAWRGDDAVSSSPLTLIELPSSESADLVYALLCSRLVYWLWRVEGDAFHVTRGFLRDLPFTLSRLPGATRSALAELGSSLWAGVNDRPITSVNKGRRTIGFSAAAAPDLQAQIDDLVLRSFSLSDHAPGVDLGRWYDTNVVVDPTDAARASRLARSQEWPRA